MLNFSTLQRITIPEGNVQSITRNGDFLWSASEKWDIEWHCNDSTNLPDTSVWDYPVGSGEAYFETTTGTSDSCLVLASQYDAYDYAMFRPKDYLTRMGSKAVLEVEFYPWNTVSGSNGFRIILGEGANGAATGRGLQCAHRYNYTYPIPDVPDSYLHIMKADAALTKDTDSVYINPKMPYTKALIRLELDTINGVNKIIVNGETVETLTNDQLSTTYADKICCMSQKGNIPLVAFRYRKII